MESGHRLENLSYQPVNNTRHSAEIGGRSTGYMIHAMQKNIFC